MSCWPPGGRETFSVLSRLALFSYQKVIFSGLLCHLIKKGVGVARLDRLPVIFEFQGIRIDIIGQFNLLWHTSVKKEVQRGAALDPSLSGKRADVAARWTRLRQAGKGSCKCCQAQEARDSSEVA